jgi:UDP-glucose 4-epimerase
VYGANTALPKDEEMVLKPLTPYAASKLAGEALMMAYGHSYDLCITTLRFFNVFGPWQRPDHVYSAVIPKWIWQAMNDEKLQVFGNGEQSRDFTSVAYVCEVILQALEKQVNHPEPINLALGNKITLNKVITDLKIHFPNLEVEYCQKRFGDVYASQNNPSELKRIFSNVKTESFEQSLGETINWLVQESSKIIGGPQIND